MAGNDESPCRFGAGRIKPRFKAFIAEVECVRSGSDPEAVHRMRVASRRLRSALPLFAACFPKKRFRGWMKGLKQITRALGEARDTDVQLAFLDQYESDIPERSGELAGIRRIRPLLSDHRYREQQKILSALDALEAGGVLNDLGAAVLGTGKSRRRVDSTHGPGSAVLEMAARSVQEAYEDLISYGISVHDPRDIQGHHALRIAAKKLRYTLEIFHPVDPGRFVPAIQNLKHLQELLGKIHDCDVWIVLLSDPDSNQRGEAGGWVSSRSGIALSQREKDDVLALLRNRKTAREDLYLQLVRTWDTSVTPMLEKHLHSVGDPAVPATGVVRVTGSRKNKCPVRQQLGNLGDLFPDGEKHALRVTELALALFDSLAPLHGYSVKERRLLEYAGLLHDIGWVHGQKGHHTSSCTLILSDSTLPVSPRERTIIALVARNHRKSVAVAEQPGQASVHLKPKDRSRVLALSALLRIADGLDYTHTGSVLGLSCTITPEAVTCMPVYGGNGHVERERALVKADLFERVFRRRFVIS